jgi:hypothetical protein
MFRIKTVHIYLIITLFGFLLSVNITTAKAEDGQVMINSGGSSIPSSHMRIDNLGNVTMGRLVDPNYNFTTGATNVTPDFFFWSGRPRLFTRSLILEDTGDPPDIAIRRNEGSFPNGDRQPMGIDYNIGIMHWQPWDGTSFHIINPDGSLKSQGRIAAIYARTAAVPTQTNRAGRLIFQTARDGDVSARDSLIITQKGSLELQENGTNYDTALYWKGDPLTGLYKRQNGEMSLAARGNENVRLSDADLNETGIWLLTNRDGKRDIQRVEVGPVDSGGPGYRALRIKN